MKKKDIKAQIKGWIDDTFRKEISGMYGPPPGKSEEDSRVIKMCRTSGLDLITDDKFDDEKMFEYLSDGNNWRCENGKEEEGDYGWISDDDYGNREWYKVFDQKYIDNYSGDGAWIRLFNPKFDLFGSNLCMGVITNDDDTKVVAVILDID